jgi:hypothetical protein
MKNLYTLTEEEKKRILGMHQNATKKQYLKEQPAWGARWAGTEVDPDNDPNSIFVLNKIKHYCVGGNENLLTSNTEFKDIQTIAANLEYNLTPNYFTSEERLAELTGFAKAGLGSIKNMADLCNVNAQLLSNYGKTLHDLLKNKSKYIAISWEEVANLLKPAFDDAAQRIPQAGTEQAAASQTSAAVGQPGATSNQSQTNGGNTRAVAGGGTAIRKPLNLTALRGRVGSSATSNSFESEDLDKILANLKGTPTTNTPQQNQSNTNVSGEVEDIQN